MNEVDKKAKAMKAFRQAMAGLWDSGVIRSHRIIGDIGESILADAFNLELNKQTSKEGYDAKAEKDIKILACSIKNDQKIEIKTHVKADKNKYSQTEFSKKNSEAPKFDWLMILALNEEFSFERFMILPKSEFEGIAADKDGKKSVKWNKVEEKISSDEIEKIPALRDILSNLELLK